MLTQEIVSKAADLFLKHNFIQGVALELKVHEKTVYNWIRMGRDAEKRRDNGDPPEYYDELALNFLAASRESKSRWSAKGMAALWMAMENGSVDAAKFILGKMFPAQLGNNSDDIKAAITDLKALRGDVAAMRAEQAASIPPPPAHPQTPRIMLHDVLPDAVVKEDE